eukprot:188528-Pelagomonas_calceolata.AAC.4
MLGKELKAGQPLKEIAQHPRHLPKKAGDTHTFLGILRRTADPGLMSFCEAEKVWCSPKTAPEHPMSSAGQ